MDSSIQSVKEYLRKLHGALIDLPNKEARATIEGALENLRLVIDFALDTEDKRDIENLASVLFNQSNGLVNFLDTRNIDDGGDVHQKSVDKKERKKGFEILQKVLSRMSNERLLDQESLMVKGVIDVCLHTFRSEKAFEECIEPLIIVLEAFGGSDEQRVSSEGNSEQKQADVHKVLTSSDGRELFDALAKSFYVGVQSIGVGIKRQKLRALGIVAQKFPAIMEEQSETVKDKRFRVLLDIFDSQLKASAAEKKEQQVLTGCLEGLLHALEVQQFTKELQKKEKILQQVYQSICDALSALCRNELSRYHLPIAAFEIFAKHTELFKTFVINPANLQGSVDMCKMLLLSCRHHNKDVSTRALKAYEAWLGYARLGLLGQKEIVSRICQQFQQLLDSDAKSRCLSLRGFGAFASAIKSVEGPEFLDNLWIQLAAYMNSVVGGGDDVNREEITVQLPSLIIAFADILTEMTQVDQDKIELLDKLVEAMFKSFPSLIHSRRFTCYQAWFFLLFTLESKGAALHHFLERSIFKNLVISIEPSDDDGTAPPGLPMQSNQRPQPCVAFAELWKNLCVENFGAWISRRGFSLTEERNQNILILVYEKVFACVAKVVNRLDLQLEADTTLEVVSQLKEDHPESAEKMDTVDDISNRATPQAVGMTGRERPRCFKDMQRFLNLVDLCQLIMRGLKPQYFRRSCFMFCKCMIEKAISNPLLSGFFKLLTSAMKLMSEGKFLRSSTLHNSSRAQSSNSISNEEGEASLCQDMLFKFAEEVVARCEQFFQDLLAACLEFVLSLPDAIRTPTIQIPALKAALKMGINHPLMAEVAFDCLEELVHVFRESLRPYLPEVLPLLDAYLIRHGETEDSSADPVLSAQQRNRRAAAMLKKKTRELSNSHLVNRKAIALRAVRMLGKLGSDNLWLCGRDDTTDNASFDHTLNILKVKLGFQASSFTSFDLALTRVVYLAETSTDRQCKVSACELLHALVICTVGEHAKAVGTASSGERSSERKRYDALFKYLLPAVFRLAVDGEVIATKLFEPLTFQIVRWFASRQNFETEAEILLDAILECVESPSDGKLREQAAGWLSEYLKWTLKGMTTPTAQEDAGIIKQTLRRLYGFMNHPSISKRLGSYMAISSVCKFLRPFEKIVDQFLLEIFHHMVLSLRYVSTDDPALNSEKAAVNALSALRDILSRKKYSEMLNEPRKGSNCRRTFKTLAEFREFLFDKIRSIDRPVRRYCRELFVQICPLTTGISDALQYFEKMAPKSVSEYIGISSLTPPEPKAKIFDHLDYLRRMIADVDVCEWLLANRFRNPEWIFAKNDGVLNSIDSFLDYILSPSQITEFNGVSQRDHRVYRREKSHAIYGIIKLVATFANVYGQPKALFENLANSKFMKVAVNSLLCPAQLGLDAFGDPIVSIEIPRQAEHLCKGVKKSAGAWAILQSELHRISSERRDFDLKLFQLDTTPLDLYEVIRMFHGYRVLLNEGIEDDFESTAKRMLKELSEKRIRDMSYSRKAAAESILRFALEVLRSSSSPHSVWSEVFSDMKGIDWRDSSAWIFYEEFRELVDEYLAHKFRHSAELRKIIFRKAMKHEMASIVLGNILDTKINQFVQSLEVKKDSRSPMVLEAEAVVKSFLDNLDFIDMMIESQEGPHIFRKGQCLDIIGRLIWLAPDVAFNPSARDQRLCKAFLTILEYIFTSLQCGPLKPDDFQLFLHCLHVAPAIVNAAPVEASKSVCDEISRILERILPLSSSKLQKGEAQYTEFRLTCDALMEAIRKSRKGMLVILLIRQHLFIDKDHIFMDEIRAAINDFVASLDAPEAQQIAADLLLSVEKYTHGMDPASLQIQRNIVTNFGVCVLMQLKILNRQRATELFASSCQFLVDAIRDCTLDSLADANKMICILQILITFYRCLDYNNDVKTVVHQSYRPCEADQKMHMTQAVLRYLQKSRKDKKLLEPPMLRKAPADLQDIVTSLLREFHQFVQNLLMTVVVRTQEKSTFVDVAFKDCAWNLIVDTKMEIKMEVERQFRKDFDALSQFLKQSTQPHLRRAARTMTQYNESYATLGNLTMEVGELPSLFGVKELISQPEDPKVSGAQIAGAQVDDASLKEEVALDADEMNDNKTMRYFVLMLDKIYEKGFHIPDASGAMPIWLKELKMVLEPVHPETSKANDFKVRLFVTKILINGTQRHEDMFRSHANEFFRAFFDKDAGIAVLTAKEGRTLGKIKGSFNSYLREICILWGSWIVPIDDSPAPFVLQGKSALPNSISFGWNFLQTLMTIAPHEITAVAKSNVKFIQIFVEQWRGCARLEDLLSCMKVIKDFLTINVPKAEEENADACKKIELCNATGLQLLNLFILQELQEFERPTKVKGYTCIPISEIKSLFEILLNKYISVAASSNKENRKYKAKKLLRPAAQVCGYILACVASQKAADKDSDFEAMGEAFKEKVKSLKAANQLDQALFAASGASSSNSSFAHFFVPMAKENLVKVHGDFQYMVLTILIEYLYYLCQKLPASCTQPSAASARTDAGTKLMEVADEVQEQAARLWNEIAGHVPKLLEKQDEKLQILSLRLMTGRDDEAKPRVSGRTRGGFLAFVSAKEILHEIPAFLQLTSSTFPNHRSEICRYQYYHLLMDLFDAFGSDLEKNEGKDVKEMKPDDLYVYLVAGLTDPSERIQNDILEWWHTRGLSMDPWIRLLDLLRRKRASQGADFYWVGSSAWLMLAACHQQPEELLFDRPLQESLVFKDMKIPTRSSVSTFSMAPMFAGSLQMNSQYMSQSIQSSQTQGTQNLGDGILDTQFFEDSTQTEGQGFRGSTYLDNQTQLAGSELFVSRRREKPQKPTFDGPFRRPFPKSKGATGSQDSEKTFFARRNEEISALKQRVKIERANRVQLLRNYRAGEVPDIQIKRQDVMRPLQRLVILDSEVAKSIFLQLANSLTSKNEVSGSSKKGPRGPAAQGDRGDNPMDGIPRAEIETCLVGLLRMPGTDSADVVDALLGIAQILELPLRASAVVAAGDRSMNFYKCIQTLELQTSYKDSSSTELPFGKQKAAPGRAAKRNAADLDGHRKKPADENSDIDWFQLSRLYHHLEEHDIVRGLYERFSEHPQTHEALTFELKGKFDKALQLYEMLRDKDDKQQWDGGKKPSVLEVDLWDNGIKDCLRGLESWDKLEVWIRGEMEIKLDDNICDEGCKRIWEPAQREDLDLYFHCLVGKSGRQAFTDAAEDTAAGKEMSKIIFDILFDNSEDKSFLMRREILETDLIPEAALGLTLDSRQLKKGRGDIIKRGLELVEMGYNKFLRMWSSSGSIGNVTKRNILRSVQHLVEIEEFYEFSRKVSGDLCNNLIGSWNGRLPKRQLDDSSSWVHLFSSRLALLQKIKAEKSLSREIPVIDQSVTTSYLTLSSLARKRGNFTVSSYWLTKAKHYASMQSSQVKIWLSISALKLHHSMMLDGSEKSEDASTFVEQESLPRGFEKCIDSVKLLSLQGDLLMLNELSKKEAFDKYQESSRTLRSLLANSTSEAEIAPKKAASIYLKCADFCNAQLAEQPGSTQEKVMANCFVENLLSAVQMGSVYARAHFPRVLDVLNKAPGSRRVFLDFSPQVPAFWLLQWLPQIFSVICRARKASEPSKKSSDPTVLQTVLPLLQRLAQDFPQAVYFGYRVVREDVEQGDSSFLEDLHISTKKRDALEKFCTGLQHLQQPEQQLEDFIKAPEKNDELYREVFQDCLDQSNDALGQYRKQFAKDCEKKRLVEMLGKKGILAPKPDFEQAKKIIGELKKSRGIPPSKQQLMQLSMTLGEYEGSASQEDGVLVPGQRFDADTSNAEHQAVKIASYDPTLVVMQSIRKPKRLIMRGTDGKDYWWLVKGGEDLRQDERVQQVFQSMNLVLSHDARCSQLRLSLATYNVTPVSKRNGIIEWVRNTKPIGDSLEDQVGKDELSGAKAKYEALYPGQDKYKPALENARHEEKLKQRIEQFEEVRDVISANALRSAVLKHASNAKREFEMRSSFAQSLAAISACHYILGIGDRHTSNILVFERTGGLLGIDFGHAFGSATQLLPIPELMPFRLTNQFLGVLRPLDPTALLKRSMTYVLSALRARREILKQTMKIFITDPTVDWVYHANLQFKDLRAEGDEKIEWLTSIKEKVLDDKFAGIHPSVVLLRELAHSQVDWIKASATNEKSGIYRIVSGQNNRRVKEPKRSLEPKDQVDALVELATDPAILSHSWQGWAPYL